MNTNIDEKKLKRMLILIMGLERNNSRTKQFTRPEMVEKIQGIIEGEVKKCL